jgi:hypothetical protein
MPLPGLHLIMKRKYLRFALANLTLISSLVCEAQSSRPDLSGIWLLDREKSDLKSPPIDTDQSRKPGTGGGGGGARTGSGRGMGGGGSGMGGGGRGSGRGVGGSTPRAAGAALKLDLDFYQIGEIADRLTIEHADPAITIKPSENTEDQPLPPLSYTADGKTHETSMANGGSIKSKTSWEGQQLVTKCKEKSALGSIEIDEARSLSDDGKTLIINLAYKGSSSHWTEKAVYRKGKQEDLGVSPRISHTHF